jgi:hypothetical protein
MFPNADPHSFKEQLARTVFRFYGNELSFEPGNPLMNKPYRHSPDRRSIAEARALSRTAMPPLRLYTALSASAHNSNIRGMSVFLLHPEALTDSRRAQRRAVQSSAVHALLSADL